jgi:protein-S-isoprenylcysteine O-methyltransferase Ste14
MIARAIIGLCVSAVVMAVVLNFALAKTQAKKEHRTLVATASMTLFFVIFAMVLRNGIGEITVTGLGRLALEVVGCALVIVGTLINIKGRFDLKANWGDHIRIYEDHTLITRGVYRFIRHPLYSGLFFMGYGAAIVYANWLGVVLMTVVFVPMMIYRARQEEVALGEVFKDYKDYIQKTGMFLPKLK